MLWMLSWLAESLRRRSLGTSCSTLQCRNVNKVDLYLSETFMLWCLGLIDTTLTVVHMEHKLWHFATQIWRIRQHPKDQHSKLAAKVYIQDKNFDHIRNHFELWYYYPRDAMLARVIEIATCLSVRLSVCLSVTRRYCVKTKKASGMISSPSGSPKTLVFPTPNFITKF